MTIREVLQESGIDRLDAELLIARALNKDRSWVIAHDDFIVATDDMKIIKKFFDRRHAGEPLAYIVGEKEFFGRNFFVSPSVLIPRPATEALIVDSLAMIRGETPTTHEIDTGISSYIKRLRDDQIDTIIDVGTGSGCIAITLSAASPPALASFGRAGMPRLNEIIGVDLSEDAIDVAERNREKFSAQNVRFEIGDGIAFIKKFQKPFLLISNPPYIPSGTMLEKTVAGFEPHEALFAGEKGMDVITPLLDAAKSSPHCIGMVIEMRSDQVVSL